MRILYSILILLGVLAGCAKRPPAPPVPQAPHFERTSFSELPGWPQQDLRPSLRAFRQSCQVLARRPGWEQVCARQADVPEQDANAIRMFFERSFIPWRLRDHMGNTQGLITGYYEPLLHGSRTPSPRYRYPIHGVPDDLLIIDLADQYPALHGLRLRGRLEGRRVVPYYTRAEIEQGNIPHAPVLLWVDDAIDCFFLHVQGSGRVELPDGTIVKLGYADQNGHPYRSIGKKLIEMGAMSADEVSLQGIRRWARNHPDQLGALLASNPSYVFFRELPSDLSAPIGALGVPLTSGYSLAVDRRVFPLGAPVYLATSWPNRRTPLRRLMMAQDTGGAIKGAIRADFFWGFGDQAAALAGAMKEQGQLWLLLPRGVQPPRPDLPVAKR